MRYLKTTLLRRNLNLLFHSFEEGSLYKLRSCIHSRYIRFCNITVSWGLYHVIPEAEVYLNFTLNIVETVSPSFSKFSISGCVKFLDIWLQLQKLFKRGGLTLLFISLRTLIYLFIFSKYYLGIGEQNVTPGSGKFL
jgi:hypothetical protein